MKWLSRAVQTTVLTVLTVLPEDYVVPGSCYLKKNSIPSQFDFLQHLQKVKNERKPPKRLFDNIAKAKPSQNEPTKKKQKTCSPSKEELKEKLARKDKKIKTLNQIIR